LVDITSSNSSAPGSTPDHIPINYEEQNTPISTTNNVAQSAELDFDLIWPDSEDLFETLMASENCNQWQTPFSTLPITSRVLQVNDSTIQPIHNFHGKGESIGAIPSGESHRAVHNVSEMVRTLVSFGKEWQIRTT
jgi:hypothetical protein